MAVSRSFFSIKFVRSSWMISVVVVEIYDLWSDRNSDLLILISFNGCFECDVWVQAYSSPYEGFPRCLQFCSIVDCYCWPRSKGSVFVLWSRLVGSLVGWSVVYVVRRRHVIFLVHVQLLYDLQASQSVSGFCYGLRSGIRMTWFVDSHSSLRFTVAER